MKRDRSRTHDDDAPLGDSDFFRRVEEAEEADDEQWEEGEDSGDEIESLLDEPEDHVDWEVDEVEELYEAELPPSRRNEGSIAVPIGWTLAVAGVGLGAATLLAPAAVGPAAQAFASIGLTPFAFCLAGLIFGATGIGRSQAAKRNSMQERRLNALDRTVRAIAEDGGRPGRLDDPDSGGDIDRMFVALQRQDEKINNLTRATKLYGKPLIEISNQVSELSNHLTDKEPMLDGVRKAVSESVETLENQIGKLAEQFVRAMSELKSSLEETQLEITESGTRARDERTKSLDELAAGIRDDVRKNLDELAAGLHDDARKNLDEAVDQIRAALAEAKGSASGDDGLDDLERGIASIQREVQGLATAMSRIESRPVAAGAPSAPMAAAAAAPPAPASGAGSSDGGTEAIAQKIAGARPASGKNVLGAIAKLKSMRS